MVSQEYRRMHEILAQAHLCFAVSAIAELGIVDLIPRGADRPSAELAREAGCDAHLLYRTLRFLASHGFFAETVPGSFALTPAAEAMRSDAPESTRAAWRMFHRLLWAQKSLEEGLRTGETPLQHAFGQPVFAYIAAHPELAGIFDAGMSALHGPETAAMLEAYDFGGIGTLADIGGGNGSLLIAALAKHPELKGILFDLGHVIERARNGIQAAGFGARCRIEPGSFFESIPAGADAYLLRHIIHDWTDEQSVAILKNCRRAIPAGGRLLVVEMVVPPGNDPSPSKNLDFLMLMYPGGMERTESEYRKLFGASGFDLAGITPTASPVSVIEARPV
jgi:O-methyltransferase domain